jgi:hypothetical protein
MDRRRHCVPSNGPAIADSFIGISRNDDRRAINPPAKKSFE